MHVVFVQYACMRAHGETVTTYTFPSVVQCGAGYVPYAFCELIVSSIILTCMSGIRDLCVRRCGVVFIKLLNQLF